MAEETDRPGSNVRTQADDGCKNPAARVPSDRYLMPGTNCSHERDTGSSSLTSAAPAEPCAAESRPRRHRTPLPTVHAIQSNQSNPNHEPIKAQAGTGRHKTTKGKKKHAVNGYSMHHSAGASTVE